MAHTNLKLKREESQVAQRIMKKLSHLCGAALAEYGRAGDQDEKLLANLFRRKNMSCTSKIELPHYPVDYYAIVCIYRGVTILSLPIPIVTHPFSLFIRFFMGVDSNPLRCISLSHPISH